jgi:hypothetical protein
MASRLTCQSIPLFKKARLEEVLVDARKMKLGQ